MKEGELPNLKTIVKKLGGTPKRRWNVGNLYSFASCMVMYSCPPMILSQTLLTENI